MLGIIGAIGDAVGPVAGDPGADASPVERLVCVILPLDFGIGSVESGGVEGFHGFIGVACGVEGSPGRQEGEVECPCFDLEGSTPEVAVLVGCGVASHAPGSFLYGGHRVGPFGKSVGPPEDETLACFESEISDQEPGRTGKKRGLDVADDVIVPPCLSRVLLQQKAALDAASWREGEALVSFPG